MSINVSAANNQASQLVNYANQLRTAKTQLLSYKSSISANWQGKEVSYITLGIEQTISQIDGVITELEALSTGVKSTAAVIKREDDAAAAAARARAERQSRINVAQTAYNTSCDELDELNKSRSALVAKIKKSSVATQVKLLKQLQEFNEKIKTAEEKCNTCRTALNAAKR